MNTTLEKLLNNVKIAQKEDIYNVYQVFLDNSNSYLSPVAIYKELEGSITVPKITAICRILMRYNLIFPQIKDSRISFRKNNDLPRKKKKRESP